MNKNEVIKYLKLDTKIVSELVKNKKLKVKEYHPSGKIKSYDEDSVKEYKLDMEERLRLGRAKWIEHGSGAY